MAQKFYLGLDIGTDSVGWAVTDENYNLIRKQGKHLWGARLFTEASDAKGRRTAREARRRLQRRRWRIVMLQDMFREEMDKVDPNFFDRLNNAALHQEDKPENLRTPYLLFNDECFTDKDFYNQKHYPTIYHLRKAMMEHPEKQFSIKEIYLVMAHMIKYRGNFLMEGEISSDGVGKDTQGIINNFHDLDNVLRDTVEEEEGYTDFGCDEAIAQKLIHTFQTESRTKYLQDEIVKDFEGVTLSTLQKNIIKAFCCGTLKIGNLFPRLVDEASDIAEKKIEFDSDAWEDTFNNDLMPSLNQLEIDAIVIANKIYSTRVLIKLLKGKASLSDAMVEIYNTHRDQLSTLKKLVKAYNPKEFNHFFVKIYDVKKDEKKGKETRELRKNYVNYIGMTSLHGKRVRVAHSCSREDLYKTIKTILPFDKLDDDTFQWKNPKDKEDMAKILVEMDAQNYLPKQNAKENGVFPYQLNKNEMNAIIGNQKQYYPFLGEEAPDYFVPTRKSYKLISLLEFKIPYFVGPLSNKMGEKDESMKGNFWLQRKAEGKITPWNFHDIIDEEKTAQGFIERMKNACTYLIGESTLPKNSLLYTEFMLLNEMNNWMVNDHLITKEEKECLIDNLYLVKAKTPTVSEIANTLKNGLYKSDVTLSTKTGKELKSEDLHANLKPFIDMASERGFGKDFEKDETKRKLAETVIFDITMFEDKDLKERQLKKLGLSDDQIKYFSGLKYKDWGKLSEKVLDGIKTEQVNKETGEVLEYTVIDLMREKPLCLMELLTTGDDPYGFRKQISEWNNDQNADVETLIDASYASPAMKRAVRQTLKIINELKHILSIDHFDTFFVECTRGAGEKGKRTKSRKKQLEETLKLIKLDDIYNKEDLTELLKNKSDADLRKKKLFLYFMQLGHSVYTGDKIELSRLDKDYDIDHIIPQAKLKDDSLDNTVLVEKHVNNRKQDNYPIPQDVLTKNGREWIEKIYRCNTKKFQLMSLEKKNRLLRSVNKPLKDEELVGFVNRQLTMTDQSVKAVCEILREVEKQSRIVFSKAGNVSEFRNVFGLVKCREINDFHHANDAYLNIVVGNVYDKVFTSRFTVKLFREHFDDNRNWKIDVEHFFKRDEYAYNLINSGACVWKAKRYIDQGDKKVEDPNSTGTIDLVRKTLSWNDPLVTQMLTTQSAKQGFFNKISLHTAEEGNAAFPLKLKAPFNAEGWEKKYGGYSDLSAPYFMLVESDGKKNVKQYSIENIPSIFLVSMKTEEEKLEFLKAQYGLKNPKIILDKLLIRTVIEFPHENGNVRVGISGKGGSAITFVNLSQMHFNDINMVRYFKAISKTLGINNPAGIKVDEKTLEGKDEFVVGNVTINRENNIKAFEYLQQNYLNKICLRYLPSLGEKVQACSKAQDSFICLSVLEQIKQISAILSLGSHNTPSADLTVLLRRSSKLGNKSLCCTKNLNTSFRIIKQSVTGFYEKVLFEHIVPEKK